MRQYDKYVSAGPFHWEILGRDGLYRLRCDIVLGYVRPWHICLDLGCGDGAYMGAIAPGCVGVVGVDRDGLAVELARREFAERKIPNAWPVCSDFKDVIPFRRLPPGAFDIVYAMDVLEHMESPAELLDLAEACMSPDDGLFVLGTPLFRGGENVSPYHVREYTEPELAALLEARFSRVETTLAPDWLRDGTVSPDRFCVIALRRRSR